MRFDQAPEDGRHCGEYRVVFAKESGRTPAGAQNRNLLIFEASLRNPHLNQGIRGCERFVRAWAELSTEPSLEKRRVKLEDFYFDGYSEFDGNRSFDPDRWNDWWHERPDRAFPRWLSRNQDCSRLWYRADVLSC